MNRTIYIYLGILMLLIIGVIWTDYSRPKPIDWSPTYAVHHKKPFGLFVLNNEIEKLTTPETVDRFGESVYEYLDAYYEYEDSLNYGYTIKGNLLIIDNYTNADDNSWEEVLFYVSYGNNAIISLEYFPEIIQDSLKIETQRKGFKLNDSMTFSFVNREGSYGFFSKGIGSSHFKKWDKTTTTVLGFQNDVKEQMPNFIKVQYGDGAFFLHTQPIVFTNYYLLKQPHLKYVEDFFQQLPKAPIHWSQYQQTRSQLSDSPLRFWMSQPGLKNAWYLFIFGKLIFMIFNAKRRQRIVPIITPLTNTTLDFVKTIGNLYFREGDHHALMDKKIIYFLERVRNDYMMDTRELNEGFIKKLHFKTNKPLEQIQELVMLIQKHRLRSVSTNKDLHALNKAIEKITF